jgi:hypothetical protein
MTTYDSGTFIEQDERSLDKMWWYHFVDMYLRVNDEMFTSKVYLEKLRYLPTVVRKLSPI